MRQSKLAESYTDLWDIFTAFIYQNKEDAWMVNKAIKRLAADIGTAETVAQANKQTLKYLKMLEIERRLCEDEGN